MWRACDGEGFGRCCCLVFDTYEAPMVSNRANKQRAGVRSERGTEQSEQPESCAGMLVTTDGGVVWLVRAIVAGD